MRKLLIPLLAAFALPTAVNAGVDPAVHNLCKDVKDYMGCVKAQYGQSMQPRMTIDQGEALITGFNSCPVGYRYKGNGFCGEVKCHQAGEWFVGNHNPVLKGKDSWCKAFGLGSGGRLDFTSSTVRASFNPLCPSIDFEPGWESTCSQQKGPRGKGEGDPVPGICTATIC